VFSAGPHDATLDQLFRDVSSTGSCPDITSNSLQYLGEPEWSWSQVGSLKNRRFGWRDMGERTAAIL
jgi:hypothetical protein